MTLSHILSIAAVAAFFTACGGEDFELSSNEQEVSIYETETAGGDFSAGKKKSIEECETACREAHTNCVQGCEETDRSADWYSDKPGQKTDSTPTCGQLSNIYCIQGCGTKKRKCIEGCDGKKKK